MGADGYNEWTISIQETDDGYFITYLYLGAKTDPVVTRTHHTTMQLAADNIETKLLADVTP
jgi:hypothetical protein